MLPPFAPPTTGFWIFAYGSLMWDPGFRFAERRRARIDGYHRALCVYSWMYRGTEDKPGLVFGLDRGGIAGGVAYRIRHRDARVVFKKIWAREMPTAVYHPVWVPCRLSGGGGGVVKALTFVADRNHEQYAGRPRPSEAAQLVAQGHGRAGPCLEYVQNTLCHLRELGIRDRALEDLGRLLKD